jgi:hypothetical protein
MIGPFRYWMHLIQKWRYSRDAKIVTKTGESQIRRTSTTSTTGSSDDHHLNTDNNITQRIVSRPHHLRRAVRYTRRPARLPFRHAQQD